MKRGRFGPVVTAMITPMRADGEVNYPEASSLARWLAANGSSALVIAGTTGEGPTLTDDEKVELFETVVKAVGDHTPVMANAGSNDTRRSVEFSKRAQECGVHGLLAVGPYYNKPPQAGMIRHFTAIADATDLPVMIYNIPGRTAVNVLPETLATLAEHPRIVAVKESSGDLGQISEVAARVPASFDIYSGDDLLALPTAAVGGCGVVSVASHVAGPSIASMFASFAAGDTDAAAATNRALVPLVHALFAVSSPIPVKAAMAMLGFDVGSCRPPLCDLTIEQMRVLESAIAPWRSARQAVGAG